MYFCIDCGLTSIKVRDKDLDILVGEEFSSCGDAFIEPPPFVDHDDRMHVCFGVVIMGNVSIDGIGGGYGVVFLTWSGDGLG